MDPEVTLEALRESAKELPCNEDQARRMCDLFEALDEWMKKGGFSPWPDSSALGERANGEPRMSLAQRNRLWELCGRYNVTFNESDYIIQSNGWVEGWIGGGQYSTNLISLGKKPRKTTIYVGVSPEGQSHS